VKIYTMKPIWDGDDNVFKNMRPMEPAKWGGETLERQKRGEPLSMVWACDASSKPVSDFIMFPGAGLASKICLLNQFKRFAPSNQINSILLNGNVSPYGLLQITNHQLGDKELPHIFMMFKHYKAMLVTTLFKDEWQRLELTGADFSEVAEMPDTDFSLLK
jgi:hypothetical protein